MTQTFPSDTLPDVRGRLTPNRDLSALTWLRVGGPADVLFQPADLDDLQQFLRHLQRRPHIGTRRNPHQHPLLVRQPSGHPEGIVLFHADNPIDHLPIEYGRDKTRADALNIVQPGRPSRKHA